MVAANTRVSLRNTRILVIEDNPQAMDIMAQVLVGFGISTSTKCETAEDGLRALEQGRFDLVILDGEMRETDGFQITRHIRSRPKEPNFSTPIIIVSGCTTRGKAIEARDCGANYLIAKPIVPKTFLDRMIWIARSTREFVVCDTYCGPDRRFRNMPLPPGVEERRADAMRLSESPQRELSQEEVDALF